MENKTQKIQRCPVCGKPLAQEEYDKALGIWETKYEQIKRLIEGLLEEEKLLTRLQELFFS